MSLGNHEYHTKGATPYFKYFGAAAGEPGKGYYSYELAGWHIISLNSDCSDIGGCGAGFAGRGVAAARLGHAPRRLHLGLLASPLVQLRRDPWE